MHAAASGWALARPETPTRTLSKAAEDGDGNVCKTLTLITEDKKGTRICEINRTFVPSCPQMRLQLLHFHAVFKTRPTFHELTFIVRSGVDAGDNGISAKIETYSVTYRGTYRGTKVKMCLMKYEDYVASRHWRCRPRLLKVPNIKTTTTTERILHKVHWACFH